MGAVSDLGGIPAESGGGVVRLEVELHHLPVALVRVVEVVERVEEPVLQRHRSRSLGLSDDVRVHDGLASLDQASVPALVVAAGIEWVAREVEVVLVAVDEVVRRGRDLHEVGGVPGATQRDRLLVQQEVDVGRDERLPVTALLRLLDDPHDRRVTLGERALVAEVGVSGRGSHERRGGDREQSREWGATHGLHSRAARGRHRAPDLQNDQIPARAAS